MLGVDAVVSNLLSVIFCVWIGEQRSHEPSRIAPGQARRIQSSFTPERQRGHSRTISVDVAELPDVNLQTGFDLAARPSTLPESDMSYAVPEENSSASAGSLTVVQPPDEKSLYSVHSDKVPLMDQSDSTSESDLDELQSVSPRRVPARFVCAMIAWSSW